MSLAISHKRTLPSLNPPKSSNQELWIYVETSGCMTEILQISQSTSLTSVKAKKKAHAFCLNRVELATLRYEESNFEGTELQVTWKLR
ncbi:unnamed protein product [Rodentolepis nana]|uniref:Uncharacterized protein n=1 Tax=Rodentolepis nana TaxID=102285 RepID=A0A0R3TH42_RODNA|nr:unnamed protein product [Rodentolepis nana]